MPTIVHFEIPAEDVERAKSFYTQLFGWSFPDSGMPGMEYWLINTSGEHPVNGGLMKRQHPEQGLVNYIDVSSVEEYAAKAERLGGKILVPKSPIPHIGYFAIFQDTEGNTWGLFQDDPQVR